MVRYMNIEEQVDANFSRARRKALLRRMGALLTNGCNRLLFFDEVRKALGADNRVYLGRRVVPVERILGSVDRHGDFDRAFLPARANLRTRWKRIDRAFHRAEESPPVSLYKDGDEYFVLDGHHRASVARYQGVEMIDAEVVELRSRKPANPVLAERCGRSRLADPNRAARRRHAAEAPKKGEGDGRSAAV